MARAIGIDLGTANSCVATLINGMPVVLRTPEGSSTIPSVYAVDAAENQIVGDAAVAQADGNSNNTIFAIKRFIGLKYDSDKVQTAKKKLPYEVVEADNGDAWVVMRGKAMSPEEVSSKILTYIKEVAEKALGEPVDRAVITCPAHFNDAQRQATRDAGRIAGLEVMAIVNEPTAAALAYSLENKAALEEEGAPIQVEGPRTIGVFDLGAGTFDISILTMDNGMFDVLSTNGDTYLGGEDFDMALVNYVLEFAKVRLGVDLTKDKMAMQRIKSAAKKAKHQLSDRSETIIDIPYIAAGMKSIYLPVSRKEFEAICSPVLNRTKGPCLQAIEDAEMTAKEITDVILIGGMTRMPSVKKYCREIFGCKPHDDINPDAAVALGAAILTGILEGQVSEVNFQDVIPLSLGLEIQGGTSHVIIRRNTSIPTSVTKVFTTSAPGQSKMSIHIVQGESKFAPDNTSLARFELTDLHDAPRGEPEVAVTFSVDDGGIVHVTAMDLDTGKEKAIDIQPTSGLSDDAIGGLIKRREMEEAQRERAKERKYKFGAAGYDDRSQLKSLIFSAQFRLDSEGQDYPEARRNKLIDCLNIARNFLNNNASDEDVTESLENLKNEANLLDEFVNRRWV
ncbi:MAG: molecular chaperone DnaK [bacterium]|nr:molecular chaperone DnaK [bacterium]